MSKGIYHRDDYFTIKAQREGVRARSYYKLEDIDRKFQIFSHLNEKSWVLDLGCSPGSWVQYVLKKTNGKANIVGIDLKETQYFPEYTKQFHFIQGNVEEITEASLLQITEKRNFSVVMSDMAPDTTSNFDRDAYLSYELVLHSWEIAKNLFIRVSKKFPHEFSQKGVFIAKYFQGKESMKLFNQLRNEVKDLKKSINLFNLGKVKLFKPSSSRKKSREIYIIIK